MKRRVLSIVVAAVVFAVFCALPVIPVVQSPVSLHPIERNTVVSLIQIIGAQGMVGMRTQATWLTLPAAAGVLAVATVLARFLKRRIEPGNNMATD